VKSRRVKWNGISDSAADGVHLRSLGGSEGAHLCESIDRKRVVLRVRPTPSKWKRVERHKVGWIDFQHCRLTGQLESSIEVYHIAEIDGRVRKLAKRRGRDASKGCRRAGEDE